MSRVQLRTRAEDGLHDIGGLSTSSTFLELKQRISAATSIPVGNLQIKCGYPPVPLTLRDDTLLRDTPIATGDTLTVARIEEQTPATHSSQADSSVAVGEGYLVRRTVPGDNNCLFRALAHTLGKPDITMERMRHIVVDRILENPAVYSDAVLGQPAEQYCQWIANAESWGGGIELAIFSDEFEVEVCSVDIQTRRIDRFGEDRHASRVILLYSGVHYDYVAFTYDTDSPADFDLTMFNVSDTVDDVLAAARELADKLRIKHEYTDKAQFMLRCADCNAILHGEGEAQAHFSSTGHVNFAEVA
ncbi:OTU-domain-containing protein [Linderina pennispora]|uniref:Ubiquitin thioesterase OTU n=1 Tax=Linderina pennispora TaxID=61395 RepID=A0A1Y1WD10_9FUNG|nr:OTU-domain-containing protein [Linderina pennispora]ORX71437.1 OTU-domain-containing protein [Linderina pennispora]